MLLCRRELTVNSRLSTLVEHCVRNYGVDCILCVTDNVCVTDIYVCHLL